jgi:hypothetical protein
MKTFKMRIPVHPLDMLKEDAFPVVFEVFKEVEIKLSAF